MLITLTELFVVDGSNELEETEGFKGEEGMCEVFSIRGPTQPLLEGWPNIGLKFFPTDG